MPLPYPGMDAVPFTPLTAAFLDQMIANDAALQNFSAFDAGTFPRSLMLGASETIGNFVASGGVLAGSGYGSTLGWTLSAGVVYINGNRYTIASTSGNVTASKDTYFDVLLPVSGTVATLVNTGGNIVANNATAPALAANSVRLGFIVSGASSIAASTSIKQTGFDSLGNVIKYTGPVTPAKAPGIWWEEIGRTTLKTAGDTLSVANLPARKYLSFRASIIPSGVVQTNLRFNNDSATNYAFRYTNNNAVGSTGVSIGQVNDLNNTSNYLVVVGDVMNVATQVKSGFVKSNDSSTSAATAPNYVEFYFKWANTSVQISRIDILNVGAGDFAIDSELVILGHD